jgi:hypothetical protein
LAQHLGSAVGDNAPAAAEAFVKAYSGNGGPTAVIVPEVELTMGVATIAPVLAMSLLGWCPLDKIDPADASWGLGVESRREIHRLSIFSPAGGAAAERTTPSGVLEEFQQMAEDSKPMDFPAFNAYHHGGKVFQQDLDMLEDARARAASEGLDTPALGELVRSLTA